MFVLSHKQLQKLLSVINTMGLNDLYRSILILPYDFNDELTNVCYEKFVTHLLQYTVANV